MATAALPLSQLLLKFPSTLFSLGGERLYKRRINWEGYSYASEQKAALTHFGVEFKQLELSYQDRVIPLAFAKFIAKPDTIYMLNTKPHSMVCCNGKLFDQGLRQPIDASEHRHKSSVLTRALEIIHVPSKEDRAREEEMEDRSLKELF